MPMAKCHVWARMHVPLRVGGFIPCMHAPYPEHVLAQSVLHRDEVQLIACSGVAFTRRHGEDMAKDGARAWHVEVVVDDRQPVHTRRESPDILLARMLSP